MLILTPFGAFGEPVKKETVGPKTMLSVIPTNGDVQGFSTISYVLSRNQEKSDNIATNVVIQKKETKIVKTLSVKAKVKKKRSETQMVAAVADNSVKQPKGNKRKFTLTAFTAGPESTGKTKSDPEYGITASGTTVKEGRTAACPKSLPFGTKLYIPSLGSTYTCEDRGGAIKGSKLDIYIEDLQEALAFGIKKNVEVFILQED